MTKQTRTTFIFEGTEEEFEIRVSDGNVEFGDTKGDICNLTMSPDEAEELAEELTSVAELIRKLRKEENEN